MLDKESATAGVPLLVDTARDLVANRCAGQPAAWALSGSTSPWSSKWSAAPQG